MLVIPSLDLEDGRSRVVWWPGAAGGVGAPTDRPERICRWFVEAGATQIHLVDLDGAKRGDPANLGAISAVAREVATPLQVAGGVDGPEQIELCFAAGATRVVVPAWAVVEDRQRLAACLRAAGDWLAVGIDGRPDRLAGYPWQRAAVPTLPELMAELADAGVRRFVLSHGGSAPDTEALGALTADLDADVLLAGGIADVALLPRIRDAGIRGVILGEALLSGAVDFAAALEAAA